MVHDCLHQSPLLGNAYCIGEFRSYKVSGKGLLNEGSDFFLKQDIVAGLSLVLVLFVPVIPLADYLDPVIVQSEYGGLAMFLVGVVLCFCTPGGDRWSPARFVCDAFFKYS